jgi:PAS domain-containing protein
MLHPFFKSVIDQDRDPVVICDLDSVILYMNPAAIARYRGDLAGKSLKDCHNADSNGKIDRVLAFFALSKENNVVYTSYLERENKDIYMVALRDGEGKLIGYYEKHERRDREKSACYWMEGGEAK